MTAASSAVSLARLGAAKRDRQYAANKGSRDRVASEGLWIDASAAAGRGRREAPPVGLAPVEPALLI